MFSEKIAACLGVRVIREIIHLFEEILAPHIWYAADLDANSNRRLVFDYYKHFFLKKLGQISDLKNLAGNIHQFLFGVFVAIQSDVAIEDNTIAIW